jgi:hypothetical protein
LGDLFNGKSAGIVSKINNKGDVVFNKVIDFDTLNIDHIHLIQSKEHLYGFAMSSSKKFKNYYLDIIKFDSKLDIVTQKRLPFANLAIYNSVSEDTINHNFLLVSNEYIDNSKPLTKTTFRRFDYQCEQIKLTEYNTADFLCNIISIPNSQNKMICGLSFYIISNTEDNIVEEYLLPSNLGWQGNIRWLKDSTYLHVGRDGNQIGACLFEVGKPAKKIVLLKKRIDDIQYSEYPSFLKSVDFITPNKIFVSGVSNLGFDITNNLESKEKSKIIITQFNENLDSNWIRYYGDDAYFTPLSMLATSDGGCVVIASRYDNTKPNQTSLYIIKVNDKGSVTATTNIPDEYTQLIAYPNPGSEMICIKIPSQGIENNQSIDFELFDTQGKKVLSTSQITTDNKEIKINIEIPLSSGLYIFVLKKNRQILGTGKWVCKKI